MLVKVNLDEILEFMQDSKDCKIEISTDGQLIKLELVRSA